MVVDIGRECFIERPDSLLALWGIDTPDEGFFHDNTKNLWVITDKDVWYA